VSLTLTCSQLSRAIEVAKELAGPLPPTVDYEVVVMPRPKNLRDVLLKGSAASGTLPPQVLVSALVTAAVDDMSHLCLLHRHGGGRG
jgi:hypothetical protein